MRDPQLIYLLYTQDVEGSNPVASIEELASHVLSRWLTCGVVAKFKRL
jgi:hypothetical protein